MMCIYNYSICNHFWFHGFQKKHYVSILGWNEHFANKRNVFNSHVFNIKDFEQRYSQSLTKYITYNTSVYHICFVGRLTFSSFGNTPLRGT